MRLPFRLAVVVSNVDVLTDWLDGGMIVLATFTINICYPGFLLGRGDMWNKPATGVDSNDSQTVRHVEKIEEGKGAESDAERINGQ